MPKRKCNPHRLSDLQRREESFCFGATHSNTDIQQPLLSDKKRKHILYKKHETSKHNSLDLDVKARSLSTGSKDTHFKVFLDEGVKDLILYQEYYIPVKRQLDKEQFYLLGDLNLKIHEQSIKVGEPLPVEGLSFRLYVSRLPSRSMLYFEWFENEETRGKFFIVDEDILFTYFPCGTAKALEFGATSYDVETQEITISVYLRKTDVHAKHDQKLCSSLLKPKHMQKAMEYFYNIKVPDNSGFESSDNIEEIYAVVKTYHESQIYPSEIEVQHHSLQVTLRPYQKSAVHWMLYRESQLHATHGEELNPLYKEVITKCGTLLYYNFYLGFFVREKPTIKSSTPGGILADEMGLGKTVEVLSCVLANPRNDIVEDLDEILVKTEEQNSSANINQEIESINQEDEIRNFGEGTSSARSWSPVISKIEDLQKDETDIPLTDENQLSLLKMDVPITKEKGEIKVQIPKMKINEENEQGASNNGEISEKNEEVSNIRKSKRRCVRFAEPSFITYEDYAFDSDSDVSWHEKLRFGDHVKAKKSKNVTARKTVKRLKQTSKKSNLKKHNKLLDLDTVRETIEFVIDKYCHKQKPDTKDFLARKAASIARKQAANEIYQQILSEFSATKVLYDSDRKRKHNGFFDQKVHSKSLFECICGADNAGSSKEQIMCSECKVWQHVECMRFDKLTHKEYYCPHCWQLQTPIPSRATLIVAPSSISQQWMDEIHKLVGNNGIKVEFYMGVHGNGFVQPRSLISQDIVITTYETLCKELDYVDLPHCNSSEGRRFRYAKRYMALPSPLPCVQWWRVCLDEAQMVESATSKTAEMALRLAAVHRWCITGTPVQHSITDLFGLIVFLGLDPYCNLQWWKQLVVDPYRNDNPNTLYHIICPILWRTAKIDVLDQIGIPEQREQMHWINFSPVEEHFYRTQHVRCGTYVLNRIAQLPDLNQKLHMLRKDILFGLLNPLLALRQACCHPQAVKGKFVSLNKTTLTMEELLKSLIKKSRVECEEAFRQVIAALNGLAGIHVIQEEWLTAVERYREVLMLIEQNKGNVKPDKLQYIHTLYNLAEILESHSENTNIPRTLRDCTLRQEAKELETTYLDKCIASLSTAKKAMEPLSQIIIDLQEQLMLSVAWWSFTLEHASAQREEHEVVERVRQALMGGKKKCKSVHYNNLLGLETMLTNDTDSLEDDRLKLVKEIHVLEIMDPQILVNEAVVCHLRTMSNTEGKNERTKKLCKLCRTSDLFDNYEKLLFREMDARMDNTVVENVRVFGKLNRNVWAEGETEKVLKAILGYAKLKKLNEQWIADGNTQLKLLDAKKKEFKHLRVYWRQLNDRISALDELSMCKMRLRLRFPHEPSVSTKRNKKKPSKNILDNLSSNLENKVETIYILEAHEVESYALRLATERSTAQCDLRRRLGQLQYLENLQRDGLARNGGSNTELCPVCRKNLGEKWSVLLCGHCYCIECLQQLSRHQANRRQICCPVCRELTAMGEISYVNMNMRVEDPNNVITLPDDPPPLATTQVLGNYSAKVEAVVRVLKNILADDPDAKALVFSTWSDMLLVLARALRDNDISCAQLERGKKFQMALKLFKDPEKKVTALLLPVHSGANGLNLIEATHVLLVEPILNLASEMQALGRVHRIGQTKSTVVHRFIVKGTIEERMHEVLRIRHHQNSYLDEDPVTVRDLYDMFASTSISGGDEVVEV